MDRFFSKLDLREIKIDPERSRFAPDEELEDASMPIPATDPGNADEAPAYSRESAGTDLTSATWADAAPTEQHVASNGAETAVLVPVAAPANSGDVLKVSSKSRPSAVAGAIAGVVRELGRAEVQAIGAGATNQAVKAVAIARDYLSETGIDAVCLPEFIDITIDNEERTAIRMVIEPR